MLEDPKIEVSLSLFRSFEYVKNVGYFRCCTANSKINFKVSPADSRFVVVLVTQDLRRGREAEVLLVRGLTCVEHDASFLEWHGGVGQACSQE